jgi:hypothetical protein
MSKIDKKKLLDFIFNITDFRYSYRQGFENNIVVYNTVNNLELYIEFVDRNSNSKYDNELKCFLKNQNKIIIFRPKQFIEVIQYGINCKLFWNPWNDISK